MKNTVGIASLLVALSAGAQIAPTNRLPTGARLDPAGVSHDVGSFPLAMIPSPDGKQLIILLNGWRAQGIQVLDRATGNITQTLELPAVFLGIAFSPDGKTLYVSGGNGDVVYRCAWANGRATLADSLMLSDPKPKGNGKRYPSGLAVSADGRTLYVAENLSDSLAVVDVGSGKVIQRFPTERYPYGVARAPNGAVYVSAWGGRTVSVFASVAGGRLRSVGRMNVARHPSALLLNQDGSRLFVASGSTDRITVVDTRTRLVTSVLNDAPPGGPSEGSTPNAFALSTDGTKLYVAEADNNAVAVFSTSGGKLLGRIPTGWYPSALIASDAGLVVLSGKGRGTGPNPRLEQPDKRRTDRTDQYTLGQISGTVAFVPAAEFTGPGLRTLTARVANANNWNASKPARKYPPFQHVIYIIKENRTYDQMFGDLPEADGDTSLLFFPRAVSPNHHALAERFGIFDRFFVNAEVSPDGHEWSTAAYVTDYSEKTIPSNYSRRGRSYDYEGENRGSLVADDVAEGGSGYLWDLAEKAGITYRNYGEFVVGGDFDPQGTRPPAYNATKPNLERHTNHAFPGFSTSIMDQLRADVWLRELNDFVKAGTMPRLEIIRLPNDHTAGMRAGDRSPRAFVADNDLALGRMIDALSHSPFWKNTVVFVLEDDAQAGPDHVDSHRSPMLTISAYNRGGVFHRFANTTDVIATIEEILGLGSMSQFDHGGRPLREIWAERPDLTPYSVLTPSVSLDERNPRTGALAEASKKLALSKEDEADEQLFNQILWEAIKGNRNFPAVTRASSLDLQRAR